MPRLIPRPPPAAAATRARRRSSDTRGRAPLRTRGRTCTRTSRSRRRRLRREPRRSARIGPASRAPSALPALPDVEYGEERLLRHLDRADLLHPLLPRLLLLEQLALARDVAAVALREHVLAPRLHRLARDHARPDRRLDRDVEHLARDLLAELLDEEPPAVVRGLARRDQRQRVDRLAGDEHVDANELPRLEPREVVVEARVAARPRLQLVVVVEHDLRERELVRQVDAFRREVLHVVEAAPPVVAELHDGADVLLRDDDRRLHVRLLDLLDLRRHLRRVVHLGPLVRARLLHAIRDVRRGDEQVEVELPLEALAHDLHVEQAEEAAPEAETERL